MRILHLLSQRPDSTGSGIYLQELMKNAEKSGHTNFLVAGLPADDSVQLNAVTPENCNFVRFETNELPFPIVGMSDVMPYKSTRFCDLTEEQRHSYQAVFQQAIEKSIQEFKPDIIHSHHLWLMSALIPELTKDIPIVTNCHGSDLRQFSNLKKFRKIVQAGCKQLDHIFALSEDQKDQIHQLYNIDKNNISVVGGGFNDSLFNSLNKSEVSDKKIKILYAGKLSYAKGIPYLLKAISRLKTDNYRFTLVGNGTGREKNDCLDLVESNYLIELRKPVNQEKLAELMKKSDLFILPSLFEGMPLVVLEALACGCNIVTTRLPGTIEIAKKVNSENIYLVDLPPHHSTSRLTEQHEHIFIESLHNQLTELLTAPTDIINQPTATSSNIEHFTWTNVFARVNKIYIQAAKQF